MRPPLFLILLAFSVLSLRGEGHSSVSPLLSGALRESGIPEAAEGVIVSLTSTFAGLTAEVHIDSKPVHLVLDIGAARTILSPEMALELGLEAQGDIGGGTSITGGGFEAQRALTGRISLGDAWTENEPVGVAKMPHGIDGVLGVSTLADWDVRIDTATKKLTLFPAGKAPSLKGETALQLTCELVNPEASKSNRMGLRVLNLSVPALMGTHKLAVVPDTGHGGTLLLPSVFMEKFAPEVLREALPALVTGNSISGKVVSRTAKLPEFTFGPDTLRGLSTQVMDATPGTLSERKGFVGLNLLRHYVMTFRFSEGELRLKPTGTIGEITSASTAGIFMTIGEGGRIIISDVARGGPGAKAGLRAGDELLEIAGRPLKTMTPEQFAAFKQLPPGSHVKVRYRRGEAKPVETTLVVVKR